MRGVPLTDLIGYDNIQMIEPFTSTFIQGDRVSSPIAESNNNDDTKSGTCESIANGAMPANSNTMSDYKMIRNSITARKPSTGQNNRRSPRAIQLVLPH